MAVEALTTRHEHQLQKCPSIDMPSDIKEQHSIRLNGVYMCGSRKILGV